MNAVVTERSAGRAESRVRRSLRVGQPESLAGLRPSQQRAAERRAALNRRRSIAQWLGRFPR